MKHLKMFESYRLDEKAGDLKALVGKAESDKLTMDDCDDIGKKIAGMSGQKLKSYLGMVDAMGGWFTGGGTGKDRLAKMRERVLSSYHAAKKSSSKKEK